MKKIVNYIVLIVVCLLPVMVDAKVNLKLNKEYDKEVFFFEDTANRVESYIRNHAEHNAIRDAVGERHEQCSDERGY
mgnify:CR=1 FL=1